MGALAEETANDLAFEVDAGSDLITRILEAGEKAFMREFDKHLDLELYNRKILFWTIKIKLGDFRPQVVAIFNKLTPGALVV